MDVGISDIARDLFNASAEHTRTGEAEALADCMVDHVTRIMALECETVEDAHTLLLVAGSLVSASYWARRTHWDEQGVAWLSEDMESFQLWLVECAVTLNGRAFATMKRHDPNFRAEALDFVRDELKTRRLH